MRSFIRPLLSVTARPPTCRRLGALALVALAALPPVDALADTRTVTSANVSNSATTTLDFTINIHGFIYLRVGSVGDGTVDPTKINTVGFTLTPSIPTAPTTPTVGNNRSATWNGTAPGASVTASNNVLPVEVRSNSGTVTLRGATLTPLSNGSATIPMSQITITSSDGTLPAPAIDGANATVAGSSGFGNRVTTRTANWTFGYAPATLPMAGSYSGTVGFTASAP